MTIDPTITIGNIVTIITLIVGVVGAWFFLRSDVSASKTDISAAKGDVADLKARLDAAATNHTDLRQRVEQVRAKGANELAEYKLLVAREYATHAAIKEIEERVVEAINRMGDRFDKYFDRVPAGPRRRGGSSDNG